MQTIEASARFNEKGELIIDNLPQVKNRRARLLIILEDEEKDAFYQLASDGLSKAYSSDEPEYSLSMVKEENPEYKK